MLADLIETVDQSSMTLEPHRSQRTQSGFVSKLRKQNIYALSDLARCSCPRNNASFASGREFHFAVSKGALLTEPWTVVLIRAFSMAASQFLDALSTPSVEQHNGPLAGGRLDFEQAKAKCEHCIEALWYLGKKSDMAFLAATYLARSLEEKTLASQPRLPAAQLNQHWMDESAIFFGDIPAGCFQIPWDGASAATSSTDPLESFMVPQSYASMWG